MRGGGSVFRGGSESVNAKPGGLGADRGDDEDVKLKTICWNVAGWSRGDGSGGGRVVESWDIRAKVINFFQPDILCMIETWLRGDEVVMMRT